MPDVIDDNTLADRPTNHMSQDNAMQAIVQFVKKHTRVFVGRLKSVKGANGEQGPILATPLPTMLCSRFIAFSLLFERG